jgi:hypothetical protein
MRDSGKIFSILMILMLVFVGGMDAQVYGTKKRKKSRSQSNTKSDLMESLWFGGGLGLNFQSTSLSGTSLNGNIFSASISPMVGYKVLPSLSFGPRIELQYVTGRFSDIFTGEDYKYNALTYGLGAFGRFKFLPALFLHTEYQYLDNEVAVDLDTRRNEIITERYGQNLFLVGGGYTSGGIVSTEIYLLYDVMDETGGTQLPIYYRFGITYNF